MGYDMDWNWLYDEYGIKTIVWKICAVIGLIAMAITGFIATSECGC